MVFTCKRSTFEYIYSKQNDAYLGGERLSCDSYFGIIVINEERENDVLKLPKANQDLICFTVT